MPVKKKVGVKKVKKSQNCGRENKKVPVKKVAKMAKNVFHGHFSFSRGKKKTLSAHHEAAPVKTPNFSKKNILRVGGGGA